MIGGRSALLSAAGGGNPYGNWTGNYQDVSLLLRGNGGGIGLADDSSAPKTLLATTPAGVTTQILKYSVASINNPIGGYFTVSGSETNPDFDFGSGDFTFEAWIYLLSNRLATLGSKRRAEFAEGWHVSASDFSAHIGGAWRQSVITASNPPINTWFHYALVRSGDTFRMYHNGSQVGATYTQSGVLQNLSYRPVIIGMAGGTTELPTDAIFDDLRISKVARYTSNFTPPTSRLPSGVTGDNVSLLFRGGTYASIPIDESPTPKTVAVSGNAGTSTTTFKYGGSALVAGTSPNFTWGANRIEIPAGTAFAYGTGDFTVEAWIYPTLFSGGLFWSQTVSGTNYFMCQIGADGRPYFVFAEIGGGTAVSGPVISLNEWSHVAIVRHAGQVKVYSNGVGGTALSCTQNFSDTTFIPTIGSYTHNASSLPFSGLIDDLRITKGVARYTKNFLPPPAELPAI